MNGRLFDVRCERRGEGVAVVASGEIDLASSPQLRAALRDPECEGATVVLDLRAVEFMDSSGLGVIVGQNKRAREDSFRFAIAVDETSTVRRILELSGLAEVLELVADPADLLT